MPSTRATILVILGIAIVFGAWWITYARPIVFCAFLQHDSIDAAACGTYDKLGNYEEQPEEALDWLLAYHGEAPSQQVMYSLLGWAYEYQDNFIDVLSRLSDEHAEDFVRRFTFAITDTGQSEQFEQAFGPRKHESEHLRRILERLEAERDVSVR